METKKHSFEYTAYASLEELNPAARELVARARAACSGAYAPYSHFRVGAALRLEGGEILTASNQESEVLPEGICAERALLHYVLGNRPGVRIEALAIASEPAQGECTPCGACRQVIVEAQKRQQAPLRVIMAGAETASVVEDARTLLPFAFTLDK